MRIFLSFFLSSFFHQETSSWQRQRDGIRLLPFLCLQRTKSKTWDLQAVKNFPKGNTRLVWLLPPTSTRTHANTHTYTHAAVNHTGKCYTKSHAVLFYSSADSHTHKEREREFNWTRHALLFIFNVPSPARITGLISNTQWCILQAGEI